MSNFAKECLAAATKKLYRNQDNDEDEKFTVVSKGGEHFKVHSSILKQSSDELKAMVTGNYRENSQKRIDFKKSTGELLKTESVESFVKFLYGFELLVQIVFPLLLIQIVTDFGLNVIFESQLLIFQIHLF